MKIRGYLCIVLVLMFLSVSGEAYGKNCNKGQPCGNSCISWSKTCRKGSGSSYGGKRNGYRAQNRLSEKAAYIVADNDLNAYLSPNSNDVTGVYKKGDVVYVYRLFGEWACLTNAEPYQWVKLSSLERK